MKTKTVKVWVEFTIDVNDPKLKKESISKGVIDIIKNSFGEELPNAKQCFIDSARVFSEAHISGESNGEIVYLDYTGILDGVG